MRKKMVTATAVMIGMMLVSTLFMGNLQQNAFDIGDYSGIDTWEAEMAFEASQTNEDLAQLVFSLCWRYQTAGDEEAREPLMHYGQILLDRAKAETIDLETAVQPEDMLQVLQVIRELGVR